MAYMDFQNQLNAMNFMSLRLEAHYRAVLSKTQTLILKGN